MQEFKDFIPKRTSCIKTSPKQKGKKKLKTWDSDYVILTTRGRYCGSWSPAAPDHHCNGVEKELTVGCFANSYTAEIDQNKNVSVTQSSKAQIVPTLSGGKE